MRNPDGKRADRGHEFAIVIARAIIDSLRGVANTRGDATDEIILGFEEEMKEAAKAFQKRWAERLEG